MMMPKNVAILKLFKASPPNKIKAKSEIKVTPEVKIVLLKVELVLELISSDRFILL
jgi:hypothetical protein